MKTLQKKLARLKRYTTGDKIFLTIVYVVLILIALICLYPMYFTVIASLSDPFAVYTGKTTFFPVDFTLEAYELVFQNEMIWIGYANTVFYTVVGTLFNLALTIPAAYALSKKRMYGRTAIMYVFMLVMYLGGGLIPTYLLYRNLDIINTRIVLILHNGLNIYNMIVTRTYFQNNIPESLFEAARIDGASEFRIFFKLVLPLSAPILAVMTLYYAVAHWSGYFSAMIYTSDQAIQPLQVILRKILILNQSAYSDALESGDLELLQNAERQQHMAIVMKYSLVFIASAPMLVAYPFIQKYFIKGMMIGSVKD